MKIDLQTIRVIMFISGLNMILSVLNMMLLKSNWSLLTTILIWVGSAILFFGLKVEN